MWQEWTNVVIGLWLTASPWILGTASRESRQMIAACVIGGLLIAAFALWAIYSDEKWQDWMLVLISLWLLIAPGTLQYTVPEILWNNVLVGFAVATFAFWSLSKWRRLV